jgi:hypothetical protein
MFIVHTAQWNELEEAEIHQKSVRGITIPVHIGAKEPLSG